VVVPSHDRAERLSILLDALAEQTLPRDRWELVVVHSYPPEVAGSLFDDHPLTSDGTLRHHRVERARASVQRNIGWRDARAPLVAFTDDDCRPRPDWLETLVQRAGLDEDVIVQGATAVDPWDAEAIGSPHVRQLVVDPPEDFAQTCNILYRRALLERAGGFDENSVTGEDIDLWLRCRRLGARLVGEPGAVVYHAVEALSLVGKIRSNYKWEHLAYVVKRNPELRRGCCLGVFYKREHFRAALALAGIFAATRRPPALAAALPYVALEHRRFGGSIGGRLRALRYMPEFWLIEIAEIGTFIKGSARYRTLLL
jgi:glycosyltransferase involved in cell wall biosynthesis